MRVFSQIARLASAIAAGAALVGSGLLVEGRVCAQAQQAPKAATIAGAWTLNKDLSDNPQERSDQGDDTGARRGDGMGRGGGFGGRGRGGFGGGGYGGGGLGGGRGNPEDMQRTRDALRDIMNAPERLTITQTESLILMTAADGRVVRLSPDGKKIKDESTKSERKTKWDGDKLVSEITGLGPGKITETYWTDPERKQLHVTVQIERQGRPRTINRIYDTNAG